MSKHLYIFGQSTLTLTFPFSVQENVLGMNTIFQ